MTKLKACSFTGHRPSYFCFGYNESDEKCIQLKYILKKAILFLVTKKNIKVFNTGMAIGFDMWAAEMVIEVKKEFPDVKLMAYLPTDEPNNKWPKETINRYNYILSQCDEVFILNSQNTQSVKKSMLYRNRALVDNCCCIITCYDGKSSGTGYTINYAKQKNIPILNIFKDEYSKK